MPAEPTIPEEHDMEDQTTTELPLGHEFLPVNGHPDDDECTFRSDGTDLTYCGEPQDAHYPGYDDEDTEDPAVLLGAVLALHKPERRYTFGDAGYSCATKRDAAEVFEVSFDQIEHFDICSHCGALEMAEGCEHDYKESLWPCETAKAAGVEELAR